MDLNAAAVIFMGGYVVVIAVAALVMSMRPGAGTTAFLAPSALAAGSAGCGQSILLGGEVEVLGNFRGRVEAVLLGARSGKLEEVTLASGGGLIEGGRVPAGAIVSADGQMLQIAEPWTEPPSGAPGEVITLKRDAAVLGADGKRLGKLRLVCFDRETSLVTGLVVIAGWRAGRVVRVPIGRVKSAGAERVTTDLSAEDWIGLGSFAGDQAIKDEVLERLASYPVTRPYARSLTVDVEDQRVRLGGYVRTQAQLEQAAAVARSVPGVLAVERRIRSDEELVGHIREALSRELGTSGNLEVSSEFGQVDIAGRVADRQALRRIDAVARGVPGVLVVHNLATVR